MTVSTVSRYLMVLLLVSTSTCGTTIVMSRESPLNRRCLWEEWRWLSTNSEHGQQSVPGYPHLISWHGGQAAARRVTRKGHDHHHNTWRKPAGVLELGVFRVAIQIGTRHLDACQWKLWRSLFLGAINTWRKFCIFANLKFFFTQGTNS